MDNIRKKMSKSLQNITKSVNTEQKTCYQLIKTPHPLKQHISVDAKHPMEVLKES